MEWINVKEKLPPHHGRVLGYCNQRDGAWEGIIDVVFDSNKGWLRCEDEEEPVFVTHWFDYPIEPPKDDQ